MESENYKTEAEDLQSLNKKFKKYLKIIENPNVIKIGYYPFRGKAQVCRLLCEYLKISYQDLFFLPNTWSQYKNNKKQNWIFEELPFLKDTDEFVVTETLPICLYIIQKSENQTLLGKTIKDQVIVQQFIWGWEIIGNVIGVGCKKAQNIQQEKNFKKECWKRHIEPKFLKNQSQAQQNNFYLGYLTIIDFFLYEILHLVPLVFQIPLESLPKLAAIQKKVSQLPAIKEYQHSQRAIKQFCPKRFFKQFQKYISQTIKPKQCFTKCFFS